MIRCDICGGKLIIDAGGKTATCVECGMLHTIERVREMLAGKGASKAESEKTEKKEEKRRGLFKNRFKIKEEDVYDGEWLEVTKRKANGGMEIPMPMPMPIPIQKESAYAKYVVPEKTPARMRIVEIKPAVGLLRGGFNLEVQVVSGSIKTGDYIGLEGNLDKNCRMDFLKSSGRFVDVVNQGGNISFFINAVTKNELQQAGYFVTCNPVRDHFETILNTYFSEYTYLKNVRFTTTGEVISLLMLKNDKPVLAILLCGKRLYESAPVLAAMKSCKDKSIPVQRYFYEFENETEYVRKRIGSVL